jgi:hypothetical protein
MYCVSRSAAFRLSNSDMLHVLLGLMHGLPLSKEKELRAFCLAARVPSSEPNASLHPTPADRPVTTPARYRLECEGFGKIRRHE